MNALRRGARRSVAQPLTRGSRARQGGQFPVWTTVGPLVRIGLPKRRERGDGNLAAKFVGLG
ncbi:MAG: hypothetical protein QOC69_4004 [Mycobacterium sp.]|jgi:hypothetical protein|nr:hypothetical protein [Mycobacterium sp.]MDT5362242.1 hypothetical protein [Mycobacterium sp.]